MTGMSYPAREGTTRNAAAPGVFGTRRVVRSLAFASRLIDHRAMRSVPEPSSEPAPPRFAAATDSSTVPSTSDRGRYKVPAPLSPTEFASVTSRLSRIACPCSMARSRKQNRILKWTSVVSDRSLPHVSAFALRSPAPPLNGFRRLGSRQSGKRLSRPRHWLQPTAAPARSLPRYGLLWLRRSRDNRGREQWLQTA